MIKYSFLNCVIFIQCSIYVLAAYFHIYTKCETFQRNGQKLRIMIRQVRKRLRVEFSEVFSAIRIKKECKI